MAKIYYQHSFPTTGTDQEQIDLIISRVKASGIPNVRVMSWENTFNIVPRLENVCNQLANAGLGVDIVYDLSGIQISATRMSELCSITRAETIFIMSWMSYGGWGTPLDWVKLFNDTAKSYGHTFGFLLEGDLVYFDPLIMLGNTGIYVISVMDPTKLPPREAYIEPYSYQWRCRWAYSPISSWWGVSGIFTPITSEEIQAAVDGLKSFLISDGTLNNLQKITLQFPNDTISPELASGVAYLIQQLGEVAPQCITDADCPTGYVCQNGVCVQVPPPRGCFIATAAFGTALAPELDILRHFRDTCLPNPITNAYYRLSPSMAELISKHESLRRVTREYLKPLISAMNFAQRKA